MRPHALVTAAIASGLVAALAIACTSFSGDEPTADPDGAPPDASAPIDAPASLDGADAAEAAARFCLAHPGVPLCADFDGKNEPVSYHFDNFTGDVQLDPTSPRACHLATTSRAYQDRRVTK